MRLVKFLVGLAILVAIAVFAAYQYWQHRLDAPIALETAQIYEVPEGAGYHRVVDELVTRGILEHRWPYQVLLRLESQSIPALRAGEFQLEPGMSGRELIALLGSNRVVTYTLTVPEGWTFRQMRERLARAPKLAKPGREMSEAQIMAALGQPGMSPEGWFFPDTYRYRKGVSDLDILKQAFESMQVRLDEIWRERGENLAIETPYEALILASLIERETGAPEERREIAGVFMRRLEKGMRLQTDPTVIYGLGDDYDGNITRADLRRPTPYNTYVIEGLPPTPIALPGRAALEAAVNPKPGDSLYFVARGDGTHQFSRSLKEHNAAVRKYILNR
ncbi:endolytic transglycosylase MltG [Pistricoccus aurantiacus]|uniref:Endolytic murein transglycosylase n=1 Tax=Pistricoccus aurantiacus TaxID=1883414 RepID=A0A5B8SZC0_9GAMM|nr:endolytic transglycosylase MltG [Pistricoccus aurantiacus]QEA40150.1 endolytic transglycosylase MltG [Pistricoccus aurantiacus]